MKKSLFEFGNERLGEKFNEKSKNENDFKNENFKKNDNENVQQAKNIYDKYKDFTHDELVNEFISTSKQKITEGKLSKEKINQTANLLSPYLTNEQKEMLSNLIGKIDV